MGTMARGKGRDHGPLSSQAVASFLPVLVKSLATAPTVGLVRTGEKEHFEHKQGPDHVQTELNCKGSRLVSPSAIHILTTVFGSSLADLSRFGVQGRLGQSFACRLPILPAVFPRINHIISINCVHRCLADVAVLPRPCSFSTRRTPRVPAQTLSNILKVSIISFGPLRCRITNRHSSRLYALPIQPGPLCHPDGDSSATRVL
jgi:hypothetical protein